MDLLSFTINHLKDDLSQKPPHQKKRKKMPKAMGFFSFFSLGHVCLRWRDGTWSSTIKKFSDCGIKSDYSVCPRPLHWYFSLVEGEGLRERGGRDQCVREGAGQGKWIKAFKAGFVLKNPLRFYPASLIRINPPEKARKIHQKVAFSKKQLKTTKFGDF